MGVILAELTSSTVTVEALLSKLWPSLSPNLVIHPPMYLPIHLPVHPLPFIYSYAYPPIHDTILKQPTIYSYIKFSMDLSICVSIHYISVHLSIHRSIALIPNHPFL